MNNKVFKLFTSILIIAAFTLLISTPSLAATASANASASPSKVKVGATVTVTVTYSASNIYSMSGTYTYDKSVLQYVSDTFGGNGNGNIFIENSSPGSNTVSGTITFKALKTGTSTVTITPTSDVLDFNGTNLGRRAASTTVTVQTPPPQQQPSKPSQPSQPSQPAPQPAPEPEKNPVDDAIEVSVNGTTYFMWSELDTVKLPNGFKSQEVTYEGEEVQMAVAGGKDLTLAYLTDKDGKNGNFFVYNSDSNSLYPYFTFKTEQTFTILEKDPSVTLPEGYVEAELSLNENLVQSWKNESGENPDFYLVYAMNSEGEKGLYLYDKAEDTMQRYFDKTIVIEVEVEPEPMGFFQKISSDRTLMGIVITLSTLNIGLLGFLAFTFFKPKKRRGL